VIDRRGAGHDAGKSPVERLPNGSKPPRGGTTKSFDALIERLVLDHFDFIWRLLRRFGLEPSDADDAAQEVFIVAARRVASIERGRERPFLYGTALRVLANVRRGMRRRRETDGDVLAELPTTSRPVDELIDDERARAELDQLLAQLPPELRRVLVLAEIEGLSVPEIASLESIPLGTAASRLRRARERLRELVAERTRRNRERSDA
jgi:RNA polymerase sigma-70 factor (ECF subfamily)